MESIKVVQTVIYLLEGENFNLSLPEDLLSLVSKDLWKISGRALEVLVSQRDEEGETYPLDHYGQSNWCVGLD